MSSLNEGYTRGKITVMDDLITTDEMDQQIVLKPIGIVINGISDFTGQNWQEVVSEIVIKPELNEALDTIDEFSHLVILFWTGRAGSSTVRKVHPKNNPELPLVGVFATRSPVRPNPVCMTIVELIKHGENILTVRGLDAFDHTMVIDIKPYLPGNDMMPDVKLPSWVTERQHHRSG